MERIYCHLVLFLIILRIILHYTLVIKVLHFRAPDETTFHRWVDTLNEYFNSQDNEDDDTQLLDQQQKKKRRG